MNECSLLCCWGEVVNIEFSLKKRTAVIRVTGDKSVNIVDQGVNIMDEGVKMVDKGVIKFGDEQKTEDKDGAATRRILIQKLNMVPKMNLAKINKKNLSKHIS